MTLPAGRILLRHLSTLFVLIVLLTAPPARAGAWLREAGHGFIAGSATLGNEDPTLNLYAEYGWRANTTLGLDLETYPDVNSGNVNFFVVRPIGPVDRTWRISWNLGGGVDWSPEVIDPTVKAGVSLGRGIAYRDQYGWIAIDGSVEYLTFAGTTTSKLDSTIGLSLTERVRGMVQLFLTYEDDALTAKLAPSLLFQPRNNGVTFQVGVEIPDAGVDQTTLKLGIWKDF